MPPTRLLPLLLAAAASVCLLCAKTAPADERSLADRVPADAGLFVEVRAADDVLVRLTEPQLWLFMAELAGQPARPEEAAEWQRRIEQTIGMKPVDAIRALFRERVAFVGEGLGRSQDAVVLCRPPGDVRELIRKWPASPLPNAGRASLYRLPNNIGLAVDDGLVLFGDPAPTAGMFGRVLSLTEQPGAKTLADNPEYRGLLARVPANPDGVLFARLPDELDAPEGTATTQPSSAAASRPAAMELPGPLRGARNVLLALYRQDGLMHFSAVGDAPPAKTTHSGALVDLVARLPERTLLAWGGYVDYPGLLVAGRALPERSALGMALRLADSTQAPQRLTNSLESATCLALGAVTPAARRESAPPTPAAALLLASRDPAATRAEWSALLKSSVSIYKLLALKFGLPQAVSNIEEIDLGGGLSAEKLELSRLLGPEPDATALAELHLCWTLDDDVLIIASHIDWLREIVAARRDSSRPFERVLRLTKRPLSARSESVFAAQTGPLGDLGAMWLRYLERAAPQVLSEEWWRAYQPGGANPAIGISVTVDAERHALRVATVTESAPADGVLRVGDDIVGVNRRRFTSDQPVAEMRAGVSERPDARWVDLLIERDGAVLVRRVPLPFVDPVQLLRRAIAIGRMAQRVVYHDETADDAGVRGFLTFEQRASETPLYEFAFTPPIQPVGTQPESAPAP